MKGVVADAAVLELLRHMPEQQVGAVRIGVDEQRITAFEQVLRVVGGDALEASAVGDVEGQ
ncbi:hypothetical protein D3C75_1355680 [compost metagenome]